MVIIISAYNCRGESEAVIQKLIKTIIITLYLPRLEPIVKPKNKASTQISRLMLTVHFYSNLLDNFNGLVALTNCSDA